MNYFKKRVFAVTILVMILLLFYGTIQAMGAGILSVISSSSGSFYGTINVDGDITVTFSKNIQNGSGFSNITLRNFNNMNIPITCKIEGQVLIISPNNNLDYGSYYIITIPYNAVKDESGNVLYQDFTLYFITTGDYTAPSIVSVVPADQAKDVDTKGTISIKFTEKIKAGGEIEKISLSYGNNSKVPINIGINGDTLNIKPLQELQYNTYYYVYIPHNAIQDLSGNPNNYMYPLFFTTKQSSGELKISLSKPSTDSKYISINDPIRIFYNESIISNTGLSSITVKDKSGNIPINVTINNSILYITPKNSLNFAYDTTYTVTIPAGAVKGVSGAVMKSTYTFSFTTEAQMQSPRIVDASPQNGVKDAAVNSTIRVTFSENIKQGENIYGASLKDVNGNVIPTDLSISNNVLNIRPKNSLEYNTEYIYTIPYGAIINSSNVPLKQDYEFKFKTDIERFNPYIYKSYPVDGAVNTTVDGGITIVFNEEIKKGENFDYISLRDTSYNELPITKELSGKNIKITPVNNLNLAYNTKYIVTIPYGAVKDVWENAFISSKSISFTTGFERFSPVIKMVNPGNASEGIQINTPIEITYNDKMLKGDNFDDIVLKDDNNNVIKCSINIIDDKIVIKPEKNLENNMAYTLVIPIGGVKDYWGGVQINDFILGFKTCLEKIPPTVKSITPVNGSRNIDPSSSFTIKFSENIQAGKTFKKISLTNGNMKNVPCTAEINNNTLTIKPAKTLDESTSYTLRIPLDAVMDKSENKINQDIIVNFTTRTGESNKDALAVNEVRLNSAYSQISVVFNKNITYGTNIKRLLLRDENGRTVLMDMAVKNNILILSPRTKLTSGKRYTLIIPATGVKDSQSKNMINQYSYSFIVK